MSYSDSDWDCSLELSEETIKAVRQEIHDIHHAVVRVQFLLNMKLSDVLQIISKELQQK